MVTPREVSGQIPAILLGRSNKVKLDQALVFSCSPHNRLLCVAGAQLRQKGVVIVDSWGD